MPLDPDGIWIIDYRTASLIEEEEDGARIAAVQALCAANSMRIAHSERDRFRAAPSLCACYVDNGCHIPLCGEIIEHSKLIQQRPVFAGVFVIDRSAVYIGAAALYMGLQVITEAPQNTGVNLPRICDEFGIARANREEFFDCIL
ncbi:hypothetical protein [Qipengyuania flava]|uniref:hypothetical protein n=1 Tax=Qipengyuania flava TaxID=192812 RepID=UPI00125D706B|nr:hypothetical protein [Qipengyuania flava]